jgi:membrane fusion protein (multidrug efflux system)
MSLELGECQTEKSGRRVRAAACSRRRWKGRGGLCRIMRAGLAVAALAAMMLADAGCGGEKPQTATPPPAMTVGVVKSIQMDVPARAEWVASLEGYTNAQIQAQVSGYLIRQNYQEGSYVHQGDVLFEIDPRPFQAVLDQAKAQLAQAQAQLYLADVNVKRDTPLVKQRAIAHPDTANPSERRNFLG